MMSVGAGPLQSHLNGRGGPKVILTKEDVRRLYYEEKKTMAEIGKMVGVTKERIRQKMERWEFPRRHGG